MTKKEKSTVTISRSGMEPVTVSGDALSRAAAGLSADDPAEMARLVEQTICQDVREFIHSMAVGLVDELRTGAARNGSRACSVKVNFPTIITYDLQKGDLDVDVAFKASRMVEHKLDKSENRFKLRQPDLPKMEDGDHD